MSVEKIEFGIHTIELYASNLKYTEIQKVIDHLVDAGTIQQRKHDAYNIDRQYKSAYLIKDGIRMRLHQSHNKGNGIGFAINPSTLLRGCYEPVALYKPTKKSWDTLQNRLSTLLEKIHLAQANETFSLSSIELTANIWLDEASNLPELIRLFGKSKIPYRFKRTPLKDQEAKYHYFAIQASGIVIKAYDKIYELQKFNRCPKALQNKKLLRLEVSMKREDMLRKLGLKRSTPVIKLLEGGYQELKKVISEYLVKLFPCSGKHVKYRQAQKVLLETVEDTTIQEQMLFLIKKTSDGVGLDTATEKLMRYYHVDKRKMKQLLKHFDAIGINPITLANSSDLTEVPSLSLLLKKK